MGLKDVLSGSGTRARPVILQQGEKELSREVASARPGTFTSVGGDLVLTNRRLIFTPLETKDAVQVLTWGLARAGAPGAVAGLPGRLGELVQEHQVGGSHGLRGVTSVRTGGGPGIGKPPTLVVAASDGTSTEFGILATRRTPNWSRGNVPPRDRMVAAVQTALRG